VGITAPESQTIQDLYFIGADEDFLRTYEVPLVAGRNFSNNNAADSLSFLINETAAKQLGLADPLNAPVSIERVNYAVNFRPLEQPFKGKIIGVVKDFHFQSLHQKIAPLLIAYRNNPIHSIDYFSVRMEAGDWQAALKGMESALHLVDPNEPIEYNFLDERLANFYRQDTKRGQLFTIATVVSICLACMGLFSLVSFMTEQRRKEIGIRKALGASVSQIVTMISSSYLRLVLLGFLLATPLAILALDQWLQTFAYRVDIGWVTIAVACGLSLLIAFLTVGYKSFKAAWENPVKSLRNE
jgi:putative ABC transport system permease protein